MAIARGRLLQEMLKISILGMGLKIANLRLQPHSPGGQCANIDLYILPI